MPAINPDACYTCLGISLGEALALTLWDTISQNIALDPVADFIARAGITDAAQIAAVNALYASAVDHGWWDKCDLIYPFVGGTAQAHAQNLKSSNFTITWVDTVTHDADGITGVPNGYGDTGYIPSSSGQMGQDSAHLGIYRRSNGNNGGTYVGATDTNRLLSITRGFLSSSANVAVNDSNNDGFVGTSNAWFVATRTDNADKHVFTGGSDFSFSLASTGLPTLTLLILANNGDGNPQQFSTSNLAGLTAGSGITFAEYTVMAADIQTFQTALGRAV